MQKLIVCIFIIIGIILIGILTKDITVKEVNAENNDFVYVDRENVGSLVVYRYYDKETKVIYMFTRNGDSGGLTVMIDHNGDPLLYNK